MAKAKRTVISSTTQTAPPPKPAEQLVTLTYGQPNTVVLRDGEVVLYRRPNSPWWQCRFKLQDGKWQRESTRHAALEHAVTAACLRYDEARFRQKLGLAQKGCSFAELAHATITELRDEMAAGRGKSVYASYITCIERYFLPYFKEQFLEQITHTDIIQFEGWRNRQMQKVPRASTLNNFASAWNRLIQTAINRGWVSSPSHFCDLRVFSSYSKIIITRMCAEHVRTLVAHHGHDAGDGDDHDATLLKRASNSPTT